MVLTYYIIKLTVSIERLHIETNFLLNFVEEVSNFLKIILMLWFFELFIFQKCNEFCKAPLLKIQKTGVTSEK